MKKSLIVLIGIYLLLFEINIFAQSYPTRPVKIIVPYPPGGATDIAARLIAGSLTAVSYTHLTLPTIYSV